MNENKISIRYAKALFQAAQEENVLDTVRKDIILVATTIKESSELLEFIENPIISSSQKNSIFFNIFQKYIHKLTANFLLLLISNKREVYIPTISRIYDKLYKDSIGIKSAILTTPKAIDKNLKDTIIRLVSKKLNIKIELEEKSDEKIIGGFILRIEDDQIDASVSNHLTKIKKELLNH